MFDFGLVVLIHGDAAALVGLQARGGQIQVVHVALPAHCIEQRIARDLLLAHQVGYHRARRRLLHAFYFLAQAHGHAAVAQMVAERLDDLLVRELEQPVALLNQRYAHAQHREHAGILHADDTAADHNQRFGQRFKAENLVAVDDGFAVDGNLAGHGGLGADGDYDLAGLKGRIRLRTFHAHLVRIEKAGDAVHHVDAVARELRFGHVHFGFDRLPGRERPDRPW